MSRLTPAFLAASTGAALSAPGDLAYGALSDIRGTENTVQFTNTFPPMQSTGQEWGIGILLTVLGGALALLIGAGMILARRRRGDDGGLAPLGPPAS